MQTSLTKHRCVSRCDSSGHCHPFQPSRFPTFPKGHIKHESGGMFIFLSFIFNRWNTCWYLLIMKIKKPNWYCLERNFLKLCKKRGKGQTQSKLMYWRLLWEFLKLLEPLEYHLSFHVQETGEHSSLGLGLWFPVAWVNSCFLCLIAGYP